MTPSELSIHRLAGNVNTQQAASGAKQSLEQSTSGACGAQTIGHRMQLQASLAPFSTQADATSQQQASKRIFCFYDIQDELRPQDLNGCLCSHVVYSYVAVRKNLSFIAGKKGKLKRFKNHDLVSVCAYNFAITCKYLKTTAWLIGATAFAWPFCDHLKSHPRNWLVVVNASLPLVCNVFN